MSSELAGCILSCIFVHGAAICHVNAPLRNFVADIWCCSQWLHSFHKSLLDFFLNILDSKLSLQLEMHKPADILIAIDKELETERSSLMKSLNLIFVTVPITGFFFPLQQIYSISVRCPSGVSKTFLAIFNSFDGEQTHKISFFIQIFKYIMHCWFH